MKKTAEEILSKWGEYLEKEKIESKVRNILQDFRRRNDYPLAKAVPDMLNVFESELFDQQPDKPSDGKSDVEIWDKVLDDNEDRKRSKPEEPQRKGAEEWFDNHSDCYADTHELNYDTEPPILVEGNVVQAITKETFLKYAQQAIEVSDESELQKFMDDIHNWADSAFGTERTALAPLHHLKKEVVEAIEAMKEGSLFPIREELADCFILILNSSSKYGLEFKTLLSDAKEKMEKNKLRKWGKPDENGVCEHVRDQIKGK